MSLPELVVGQADQLPAGCCCDAIEVETPRAPRNRPALSAIEYRPGRYADYVASQHARLTGAARPALALLGARDTDDFSIALIDGWACTLEVLSFYQDRLANEAFLGTALERRSIVELGRLIGYQPDPGVSAETDIVFTMDDPPGAAPHVSAVTIPARSRVQSIPGPDEKPQVFETAAAIEARPEWNAVIPRQKRPVLPANGHAGVWLAGVATALKPGDAVLVVGRDRDAIDSGSERWAFRYVAKVVTDPDNDRTWIAFSQPLSSLEPGTPTPAAEQKLFALRSRASLFGWNAPHPKLLAQSTRTLYGFSSTSQADWSFTLDSTRKRVHLDALSPGFVEGGWVVMTRPSTTVEAFKIVAAVDSGVAAYAVSGRTTRLTLDSNENFALFQSNYRRTSVYGQSEELPFAEWPVTEPVMGDEVALAGLMADPGEERRLVVSGRRAAVRVAARGLSLTSVEDGTARALVFGEVLQLMGPPVPTAPGSSISVWTLQADGGFTGTVSALNSAFRYVAAPKEFPVVAERASLGVAEMEDATHALWRLEDALANAFDRATCRIHANVARASHGETTDEILGNGRADRAFQSFALKQAPLTYVSAATPSGSVSTLEVRVDDILWHEVPTLYGHGGQERIYEVRRTEDGGAVVVFGDGRTGARLPTGRNNVVAKYRKTLGRAGSVRAGALANPHDRPIGLKEATNPIAASGGQDAETLANARANAPVTVLTLGRVVSLRNYEDFARGFAGIAKARADLVWDGEANRIVVSAAGPDGEAIDPESGAVFGNLTDAFEKYGDPFVRATLLSYRAASFRLRARVATHKDYERDAVLAAIETRLRADWSFAERGFASLVASSAILESMHAIPGVVAVDLDALYRTSGLQTAQIPHARLLARSAEPGPEGIRAAEILTLDPAPLTLEPMA
jgi:hypothetical protein